MSQDQANGYWINPLLKRLNLIRCEDQSLAGSALRKQIDDSQLTERIGELVSEINQAAGYHILEMVDFLPPQKNVLRLSFHQHRVKHNMEIVIRETGLVMMFSTTKQVSSAWERYISSLSRTKNSTLIWEEDIRPAEILDENIQAWVSYLLSGLDKNFRLDQILHASVAAQTALTPVLRKLSA